jgi:hypothetical protein
LEKGEGESGTLLEMKMPPVWLREICGDQAKPCRPDCVFGPIPKNSKSKEKSQKGLRRDLIRFAYQGCKLSDSKIKKKVELIKNSGYFENN